MVERYEIPEVKKIWSDKTKRLVWVDISTDHMICNQAGRLDLLSGRHDPDLYTCGIVFKQEIKSGRIKFDAAERETKHDVAAYLQVFSEFLESKGKGWSKYLHVGMTSSDLVDTANAILMSRSVCLFNDELDNFSVARSLFIKSTIECCGYTHGVVAESIDFFHRFRRVKIPQLEYEFPIHLSGVMGNYAHTDQDVPRQMLGRILGRCGKKHHLQTILSHPFTQNAERAPYARLIYDLADRVTALEKLAVDMRLLVTLEELKRTPSKREVGSTAMPHKINPWQLEQVSGMARLVRAMIVPALENCVLWLERDMSHSSVERVMWPDAFHLSINVVRTMTQALAEYKPNLPVIKANLQRHKAKLESHSKLIQAQKRGVGRVKAHDTLKRKLR